MVKINIFRNIAKVTNEPVVLDVDAEPEEDDAEDSPGEVSEDG